MKFIYINLLLFASVNVIAKESICIGTTSNGRLEGGVKLPEEGVNFVSYSSIADMLGRTYVHSRVKNIILDSYKNLEAITPGKVFKYAETGFESGGKFNPHKTHQNGLSVDFMVPVVNRNGQSVHLPSYVFNRFGYDIEFDKKGQYGEFNIDFVAMGAHLVSLHKEAIKHDAEIWRVIFDPGLQSELFKTKYGEYLKRNIYFSKKRSWVRHDEHYHVDFKIRCK